MPYADPQKHLERMKEYARTPEGKAARLRANRAYRNRRPDRLRAHNAVSKAILRGKLVPWPVCAVPDCCETPEAHHPDYNAPLDVVWLCTSHHKQAHQTSKVDAP
jgi:hypothetical protein